MERVIVVTIKLDANKLEVCIIATLHRRYAIIFLMGHGVTVFVSVYKNSIMDFVKLTIAVVAPILYVSLIFTKCVGKSALAEARQLQHRFHEVNK